MGFCILNEQMITAETNIECDGCKAMVFGLGKKDATGLSNFNDIKLYVDAIRDEYKILPGMQYVSLELVNEDTGEVKTKKFRPEILELLFKYSFCPSWLKTEVLK